MNKRLKQILCSMIAGVMLLFPMIGFSVTDGDPLVRTTQFGKVKGYADKASKTWVWKGVPFATPPVGALRWKAPKNPVPWQGIKNVTKAPAMCMQNETLPTLISLPNPKGSEDCLYLNIFRPQTDEKNLPVYFWIHGGANIHTSADLFNLENLARRANLVAVVIQYRLNAFGWFTHPALRADATAAEASGNFGILDQIQALKWVRDNISAFGGNPYNVTIAGESAGGHNTTAMMISPLAKGLFHRAIMESGGMISQSVAAVDATANRTIDIALMMKGKAKDMAQAKAVRGNLTDAQVTEFLRGLSPADLLRANSGGPSQAFNPFGNLIEDGYVIPGNLLCTIESGKYNKVPFIAGANERESGSINTLLPSLFKGMPNYQDLLLVVEGKKKLDDVLPDKVAKSIWKKTSTYGGKFWRAAMVDELVRRMARHQDDVYAYAFNWGEEDVRPGDIGFIYGAAHMLEIPFFQANADSLSSTLSSDGLVYSGFTQQNLPGRKELTTAMVAYLAQFVRTGNPNQAGSGLPEWKPWSNHAGGPKAIILDANLNKADIRMDNTEISMATVRYELDADDPNVQMMTRLLSGITQPYTPYDDGNYEYNVCR